MSLEEQTVTSPSSKAYCWMPTMALASGMVLARPVLAGSHNQVTLRIAVGSTITTNTIDQLINKGVECVAVYQAAAADQAANAEALACYEQRLAEIFGAHPNDTCCQLMSALLTERLSKC